MALKCAEAEVLLHAYLDGELTGSDRGAYETHLLACASCAHASRLQGRFKAALRGHLPRPELPGDLQERIHQALMREPAPKRRWVWQAHPRAFTVAMAAMAAVVLLVANPRRNTQSQVLEQALSTFHHDMPLDVLSQSCSTVTDWFRGKLDFTVQQPAVTDRVACRGGRLVNVRDRFGAYVLYQVPAGHRLGLMVFPADDDLPAGNERRLLRGRDVYVGTNRGVSTAAYRDLDGLTYVFTTDLDPDTLASWVETVFMQGR